ncbi:hypothetical protein ACIQ7D_10915 [Streptomyces sp. NPDC096310]|uniref:hypothetical protein n=1 Tax=Streptomyces sp. NPDC096310 TaxID=3366082 RepID=UPI00381382B9
MRKLALATRTTAAFYQLRERDREREAPALGGREMSPRAEQIIYVATLSLLGGTLLLAVLRGW